MEQDEEERRRDLELTRACAAGDAAAQSALKQRYDKELASIVRRMGVDPQLTADIVQAVWAKLFVPVPPDGARIGTYSGKGSLSGWLRMVVTRAALDALEARGEPVDSLDEALDRLLASPNPDPEVEYLKELYSAEFREAFRGAAATLTVRQRNLLRQYFVSELSIDQLGALYGMHRATAARQVKDARKALVAATRAELAARLQLSTVSVESIIRLIESRIDLDLGSF